MKFFDYLFNKMKWWNTKVVLDFSPFFSSIIIIAVFQGFNLFFVLNFIKYFWNRNMNFIDKYFLIIPVLFLTWNYLYYRSPKKQKNIERWALNLSIRARKIYNTFIILYFILSFFFIIWIGYLIRHQN